MTKKFGVAPLKDFNPAHYLDDSDNIRAYIWIVEEEGDVSAFSEALNTIFLAMEAKAIVKALGTNEQ